MRPSGPGQVVVLLVERDRSSDQPLVLKRAPQHARVGDRQAVVREPGGPGVAQLGHLGQLLAPHAPGYARQESRRDGGLVGRPLAQRPDVRCRLDRWLRVRHRQNPAVAPRSRGASARLDVLLVLVAGGAEVHVRVEEGREHGPALGLDQLDVAPGRRLELGASGVRQLGDLAASHDHVVGAVDARPRVEHRGSPHHQVAPGCAVCAAPIQRRDRSRFAQAGSLIGVGSGSSSGAPARAPPGRGRSPARSS